ncbi:protein EFR3 like B, partial [Trifolium medium]|nr:protein EFR3 like B [Trifolium medium]
MNFFYIIQDELSSIKKQLAQGFSPDDAYPLGPPLFMETPRSSSPIAQIEFPDFDEIVDSVALMDEKTELEPIRSHSNCKSP